ncbi:MAG: hypothetical protein Fur0010_28570 [Bdellovibrio sp.]
MLAFILLFFTQMAQAQWSMDFMLGGASNSVYRGAQTWPHGSVRLGPGFSYNQRLFIQGPHVYWAFFDREDNVQFILGVHYFDDNEPMISLKKHEEDYRNRRKNSLEFYSKGEYKFGPRNLFNLNFHIARDFISYEGLYAEVGGKIPVLPFTSLTPKLSFAEQSANRYLYGPEGVSGVGYSGLGLRVVFPKLPFPGIAFISFERTWVLQGQNKQADYVRGAAEQDVFSLSIIAKIF